MEELKREQMFDNTEKLLFDILQELKAISLKINSLKTSKPSTPEKKTVKQEKKSYDTKKVCKYCGKVHDKPVDYMNCAREHKKLEKQKKGE
jgi:ribosomal protein L34E